MRIVLAILLLCLTQTTFAQPNWQLQKDEQGIKVYTSENATTGVKAVKVEVEFTQPIDEISTIIMDVPGFPNWIYGCIESTIISRQSDSIILYRHVTDAPWPFEDRDQISKFTKTKNKSGSITIASASQPGFPEREGFVRITQSSASWVLSPQKNGTVKTVYNLSFDPGGNIPDWMVNVFITDGPFQTFMTLKKMLEGN
jgi:hypothetical protein